MIALAFVFLLIDQLSHGIFLCIGLTLDREKDNYWQENVGEKKSNATSEMLWVSSKYGTFNQ